MTRGRDFKQGLRVQGTAMQEGTEGTGVSQSRGALDLIPAAYASSVQASKRKRSGLLGSESGIIRETQ